MRNTKENSYKGKIEKVYDIFKEMNRQSSEYLGVYQV